MCYEVFAVRGSLPIDFEGAYVSHGNTLSWMSNNTKKMRPPPLSAVAIATPTPAPMTTADSFPALSSKALATEQTPQTAKFSYAAAASSFSATAKAAGSPLPVQQLRDGTKSNSVKGGGGEEIECWTLTSTREFGSANKV